MRISPFSALILSFASWLSIGIFLLYKGLRILVDLAAMGSESSLMTKLGKIAGGHEQAVLCYIFIALFLGFIKGRFVLSKTVNRLTDRLFALGRNVSLSEIYPRMYFLLIGSMILLGISLKWLPIAPEVRGVVDVAVGSSLINGSLQYLRMAFSKGKNLILK
jgi:hypothetical protein